MEESAQKPRSVSSDDFIPKKTKNSYPSDHISGSQPEKRWETLFDPHYTFTKTTKYEDPMVVREKGLERQASLILQQQKAPLQYRSASLLQLASSASTLPVVMEEKEAPSSPKRLDHHTTFSLSVDDYEPMSVSSNSASSSPTLPCMQDIIRPILDQPNQVSILPCPSQSLDELQLIHMKQTDEDLILKERLDLLNSIHQGPGRYTACMNGGVSNKIREAVEEREKDDGCNDDDDKRSTAATKVAQKDSFSKSWWQRSVGQGQRYHPYQYFRTKVEQLKEESELPYFTTQLLILQEQEKKRKSSEEEETVEQERPPLHKRYRPSFLYFFFGFFLPPLWIAGAFYKKRSEKMAKADYQWKKRSRNALALLLTLLLLSVLLIVIFNPSLIGWRNSSTLL